MDSKLEESIRNLLEAIRKGLEKKKAAPQKDPWERGKVIAQWFAAIALPVVLGIAGHWVTLSLDRSATSTKMVELATNILTKAPEDTEASKEIRGWAVDVIGKYSGVPVPQGAREALQTTKSLPTVSFAGIVGTDDRVPVENTSEHPYDSVCQITTRSTRGTFISSGTLVHPRVVLVASFALNEEDLEQVTVYIAPSTTVQAGNGIKPVALKRRTTGDREKNYSFLILPPDPNRKSSFVLEASGAGALREGAEVMFAGFPGDRPGMIRSTGKVLKVTPDAVYHDLDTGGGASGGPIWIWAGHSPVLKAIHLASGLEGEPGKLAATIDPEEIKGVIQEISQ